VNPLYSSDNLNNFKWPIVCDGCGNPYPEERIPFRCPDCGEIYNFASSLLYAPISFSQSAPQGLTRFRNTFPLPAQAPLVCLGEGNTPLLDLDLEDRTIYLKCEYLNPTGSFKDRGSVVLVSVLAALGVNEAVEDSSGNAGSSFAAYAARAGIKAKIFVPHYASGPKREQIASYGAEIISIEGPRSATAEAVLREAEAGAVYASHVYLPHGLAGMATVAFEIVEQLGKTPGAIVLPVGHGSLLLGIFLGFKAMMEAGVVERIPSLVGVQAQACAPIWKAYSAGASDVEKVAEGTTVAEGIRILHPLRAKVVLEAIEVSKGMMVAVDEEVILEGRDSFGKCGFYVEPTSAVVWPAMQDVLGELKDPVVAILTGSGLKTFPD
jgi:threonine synthase